MALQMTTERDTLKAKSHHQQTDTDINVQVLRPRKTSHQTKSRIIAVLLIIFIIGIIIMIFAASGIFNKSKDKGTDADTDTDETIKMGLFGKYPIHGGNVNNQQISINSTINENNINLVKQLCYHNSSNNGFSFGGNKGYIVVDDNNLGYFANESGYMNCYDLTTCNLIWNVNIGELLNDNTAMPALNTPTLYINNDNIKTLLIGVTAGEIPNIFTNESKLIHGYRTCYLIAININDAGSLLWNTIIVNKTEIDSIGCMIHGVMIDNEYAYGGLSSFANVLYPNSYNLWRGRAFKIDINTGLLVNIWSTIPEYDLSINRTEHGFYSGASIWPIHALIDDYFVFGTGNLYTYPRYVQQCLFGDTSKVSIDNARYYNPCGQDMSNVLKWRCLENDIHTDSLIILNKNTFELEAAVPFYGVDAWSGFCDIAVSPDVRAQIPDCPQVNGPDADSVAVAAYHHNEQAYVAVGQKTGQFYVVEVPSGEVKISKKIGPWGVAGGLSPFSLAVDEENMIAIASFRGSERPLYRYILADGTIICDGGSIHAIDLITGYSLWQWANPYGIIDDWECGTNTTLYDDYFDVSIEGSCERSFDGTNMLTPNETNVIIPPIDDLREPVESVTRAINMAPVTISNNMVFIPTITGEIYIHNILNGDYINKFQCPDYQITFNNVTYWNREAIRSGITIYENKIIYYCGASWQHPSIRFLESNPLIVSSQLIVMDL